VDGRSIVVPLAWYPRLLGPAGPAPTFGNSRRRLRCPLARGRPRRERRGLVARGPCPRGGRRASLEVAPQPVQAALDAMAAPRGRLEETV